MLSMHKDSTLTRSEMANEFVIVSFRQDRRIDLMLIMLKHGRRGTTGQWTTACDHCESGSTAI